MPWCGRAAPRSCSHHWAELKAAVGELLDAAAEAMRQWDEQRRQAAAQRDAEQRRQLEAERSEHERIDLQPAGPDHDQEPTADEDEQDGGEHRCLTARSSTSCCIRCRHGTTTSPRSSNGPTPRRGPPASPSRYCPGGVRRYRDPALNRRAAYPRQGCAANLGGVEPHRSRA